MFGVDWNSIFALDRPFLEIIVRGSAMYLSIFILLRVLLKRESGTMGIADLLVIVLIADAAQNAMTGTAQSVTGGLLLVGTILFWSYALDWIAYQFPWLERFINPQPLTLIKNGELQRRNLRREFVTLTELKGVLRENGIEDISQVKEAFMESDGHISVVPLQKSNDMYGE